MILKQYELASIKNSHSNIVVSHRIIFKNQRWPSLRPTPRDYILYPLRLCR